MPASVASGSLALIGLANIAGSLLAGSSISRYRSKHILAVMYASRALLIAWYLVAPKTEWTFGAALHARRTRAKRAGIRRRRVRHLTSAPPP